MPTTRRKFPLSASEPIKTSYQSKGDGKPGNTNFILIGLLVVAAFALGHLFTRVQQLEKGVTTGGNPTGTGEQAAQAQPTSVPKANLVVNDDDPVLGPKDAKVTVIVFEDFQCPFCGAASGLNPEMVKSMQSRDPNWQPAETNIIKDFVDTGKVRLVWKDYPFLGQESVWAAAAARCAQDQGKFWEYHKKLFSSQKGENEGAFSKENLKKFATELKLDTKAFNDCMDTGKHEAKVQQAVTYGQSVGVSGTPASFVNGQLVSGAAGYATFKPMIEAELNK